MTHLEIIEKLIGKINPIGETNEDDKRFDNLIVMCDLVEELLIQVERVLTINEDAHEFSKKRAAQYVKKFLTNRLGLQ